MPVAPAVSFDDLLEERAGLGRVRPR
jgi:hypothetical protein